MAWEVEYTNEFGQWWQELSEMQQDALTARGRVADGART